MPNHHLKSNNVITRTHFHNHIPKNDGYNMVAAGVLLATGKSLQDMSLLVMISRFPSGAVLIHGYSRKHGCCRQAHIDEYPPADKSSDMRIYSDDMRAAAFDMDNVIPSLHNRGIFNPYVMSAGLSTWDGTGSP